MDSERQVHRRVLSDHRETIAAVIEAGKRVAAAVEAWPVTDPDVIRHPLEGVLREGDLLGPLLGLLETGAVVLEAPIRGEPVAAPPYLAVTSQGPVCRGTLSNGQRLVVELRLFGIERQPRRYRFLAPDPGSCLRVDVR